MALYSVDRGGFCRAGKTLNLEQQDPLGKPFFEVDGIAKVSEVASHVRELFPEGLSVHGWYHLLDPHIYQVAGQTAVVLNYERAMELIFEFVRRSAFPQIFSRFQSYFAWDSLEAARSFARGNPIFEVASDKTFRADQNWLRLGYQSAMTSLYAHQYWSGAATQEPRWEILLAPPVRVMAVVS